jgi:hypothetical protein
VQYERCSFDIDIEQCSNCGGALKIIAAIEDPPVIVEILSHLGLRPPTPPTRVPLTTPPFRHAADRVTKSGRKAQRAQGGGLFNKSLCAALRPMFVRASSSAPARAGLSWQRRALMNNTKPRGKADSGFLRRIRKGPRHG